MALEFRNIDEKWYTVKEMAEKLGKKPQTLRMWKSKGIHPELQPIKFGGNVFYSSQRIIDYLQSH